MRKQTDFKFRVYPVGNTEGNYNHEMLSAEIKVQYLDKGWEVLNSEVAQVTGQQIMLAITLVKYEQDEVNALVGEEVKRGPGRPKKEEVAPA